MTEVKEDEKDQDNNGAVSSYCCEQQLVTGLFSLGLNSVHKERGLKTIV